MSEQENSSANRTGGSVYFQLALGMAIFGSATPISKIVTGAMPVFVGSMLRVAIGALALLPFIILQRSDISKLGKKDWIATGFIALAGMFGFTAFMLYGMKMVSGVVGAIVMSTTPAVTAIASMVFFGDKPTWRKITAIALAVVGVLILHLGRSEASSGEANDNVLLGSLLVFAAVCCEAAYTLLGKKVSEHVDPTLVAGLAAAIAVPVFIPFAIWQWPSFEYDDVTGGDWAAVIWYGLGTLALGTWLWYAGVRKAEGAVAAGFMGIMPVSALVLSYILLGEEFLWRQLIGFAVVFVGVLLMSWEHARMSHD